MTNRFHAFDTKHMVQFAGAEYGQQTFYAVEYGMCRSVFRDQACNYSYREFWV